MSSHCLMAVHLDYSWHPYLPSVVVPVPSSCSWLFVTVNSTSSMVVQWNADRWGLFLSWSHGHMVTCSHGHICSVTLPYRRTQQSGVCQTRPCGVSGGRVHCMDMSHCSMGQLCLWNLTSDIIYNIYIYI